MWYIHLKQNFFNVNTRIMHRTKYTTDKKLSIWGFSLRWTLSQIGFFNIIEPVDLQPNQDLITRPLSYGKKLWTLQVEKTKPRIMIPLSMFWNYTCHFITIIRISGTYQFFLVWKDNFFLSTQFWVDIFFRVFCKKVVHPLWTARKMISLVWKFYLK